MPKKQGQFIDKIITILKDYGKVSLKTIERHLQEKYSVDVEDYRVEIKNEINQAVRNGSIKQIKNSYEIGDPSAPPE
jgi:predicted transcriptional regulator